MPDLVIPGGVVLVALIVWGAIGALATSAAALSYSLEPRKGLWLALAAYGSQLLIPLGLWLAFH